MKEQRGTGRTTRLINEAKRLNTERRAVYVVMANARQRVDVQRRIDAEMASEGKPHHGIKVETPESLGRFDWERLTVPGMHPNCVVLVDHYAIEARFGRLLEMLHRYDE